MADYYYERDPYLDLAAQGMGITADMVDTYTTNKSNERNVWETNEANKEMNQANIAANRELWQMQADWNSLPMQVARAKAAGFSPAALLGSSGFNSTVSGTQIPPPIAMHPFQRTKLGVGQNIREGLAAFADFRKQMAEAEQVEIDNKTRERGNKENIRKTGTEADKVQQEMDFFDTTWNSQQARLEQEAYKAYEEGQKAKFEADIERIEDYLAKRYGEDERKKKLSIMDSNISLIQQQVTNAVKEGKNLDATRDLIFAQKRFADMQTREKQRYLDFFNDTYDYEVNKVKRDGMRAWYDYLFDQAHYMDILYNEFEKNGYSVSQAKEMVRNLEAQRKRAELDNQFYYADKLNTYIGTLQQGIATAQKGRFTDAYVESAKTARKGYRETIIHKAAEDGFYREIQRMPGN